VIRRWTILPSGPAIMARRVAGCEKAMIVVIPLRQVTCRPAHLLVCQRSRSKPVPRLGRQDRDAHHPIMPRSAACGNG
jgi:hypothetical protein